MPGGLTQRRWCLLLGLITLLGAGIRIGFVAQVHQPSEPGWLVDYDPIYYHRQAVLVADGRGFLAPYVLDDQLRGPAVQSAAHPPLTITLLAAASRLGLRSFTEHRVLVALFGAAAIPVVGLLGSQLAGRRAGLFAAATVAVLPSWWLYDGLLMPEALAGTLTAAALTLLWRTRNRPSVATAAAAGAAIGLAALTRGELLLLLPMVAGPLLWQRRTRPDGEEATGRSALRGVTPLVPSNLFAIARRQRPLVIVSAATLIVLAPWMAFNASRFDRFVPISTASDTVIAGANCSVVYSGAEIGSWNPTCVGELGTPQRDESVAATGERAEGLRFVRTHLLRVPAVVAARVGRIWELFRPSDNVTLGELQGRPRGWTWLGTALLALLVPAAVVGGRRLRRSGVPILPLVMLPAMVTMVAALTWGAPRFRRPAELALVLLACGLFGRHRQDVASDQSQTP